MAVTFKVPSSPKKDVFEIDNFLGVDLTNTGSNIDEVRSPNAPNMVRYVPGKVRKRTGYKTQVEFSTGTNVNRALGTSEDGETFNVENSWMELYDVVDSMHKDIDYYYDFEYCCDGNCSLFICSTIPLTNTDGEWIHLSGTTRHSASGTYGSVQAYSANGCELKIRNMAVMLKKNDSYVWRKAPEDDNTVWVKTTADEPIYGAHSLKVGSFDGNRVIGVNRIKNTSSDWVYYPTPPQGSTHVFQIYEKIPIGQKVKVQFEYRNLYGNLYFYLGTQLIGESDGTSGTFSEEITLTQNTNYFEISSPNVGYTFELRNLILAYSLNDEEIEWSASPEESGRTFNYNDLYNIDSTNSAARTSFSDTLNGTTGDTFRQIAQTVQTSSGVVGGLTYITFVASASAFNGTVPYEENALWISLITNKGGAYENVARELNNISNERYIGFVKLDDDEYIADIAFIWGSLANKKCELSATVSGIEIHKADFRQSYDVFSKYHLYHVGTKMYMNRGGNNDYTLISSDMNAQISKSWQIGESLYVIDGKKFRRFNKSTELLEEVYGNGHIPTVVISRSPSGGGVDNEPYNMLQPAFINEFLSDGTSTNYQLSSSDLDASPVKVWQMNNVGEWVEKEEGTDYTVHRYEGIVSFTTAPGTSPVSGADNVRIQAYKTISDYADRINKCTIGTLFGVNGESDRLFLSGNPDHKNWDFFSEKNDPTYFLDTGYSSLGLETSAIIGYSKVNNYLATHKDEFETEQNVLVREGDLIKRTVEWGGTSFEYSDPAFKLINTIQGAGAIGKHTFGNLQTEPIFLTKSGLYAITAQDLTGEKYGQNRSFYLNGQLLKEENLENAVATVYNDMYILAVNNKLYILDGLQPVRTDKSEPYATRQYVGFYCTDVPANIIFTQDDALWIGTFDGKICRFATDIEDLKSYNDDGKAIYCCWETPDLDGRLFYKNKTFRYFAIRMMKALRTSVALYSQKLGAWTFIKEDASSGVVFDFENIDFELFSFSTDTSEKVVHTKMRVKKVDKARFKVENGKLNEPFGLFDLALEYVESGNYKG